MEWPFRRRRDRSATPQPPEAIQRSSAGEEGGGGTPVIRAPRNEWRQVAPLRLSTQRSVSTIQREPAAWLSSFRDPTRIEPLRHGLDDDAPIGVIRVDPVASMLPGEAQSASSPVEESRREWRAPRHAEIPASAASEHGSPPAPPSSPRTVSLSPLQRVAVTDGARPRTVDPVVASVPPIVRPVPTVLPRSDADGEAGGISLRRRRAMSLRAIRTRIPRR
jgi:hypothetical protein